MIDPDASSEAERILSLAGVDGWTADRVRDRLVENSGLRERLLSVFEEAEAIAEGMSAEAGVGTERTTAPIDWSNDRVDTALTLLLEKTRVAAQALTAFERSLSEETAKEGIPGGGELLSLAASSDRLLPKPLEVPSQMSIMESMRALGVLESLSRSWDADTVIGINEGGTLISQYLQHRLPSKLRESKTVTFKNDRVDLAVAEEALARSSGKVLVVDDISRTGRTLKEVHSALSSAFPKIKFECASLVSAIGGTLGSAFLYGFAASITTDARVSLPWWTKGKLTFTGDRYFFGTTHHGIPILKFQAEAIQRELAGTL